MLKFFLWILLLTPLSSFACSCVNYAESLEEEFKSYDFIFLGQSSHVEHVSGGWADASYKTQIYLTKIWKGNSTLPVLTISTETESSSCGAPAPKIGHEFLVFANKTKSGELITGGCSTLLDITSVQEQINDASIQEQKLWNSTLGEILSALGEPEVVFSK